MALHAEAQKLGLRLADGCQTACWGRSGYRDTTWGPQELWLTTCVYFLYQFLMPARPVESEHYVKGVEERHGSLLFSNSYLTKPSPLQTHCSPRAGWALWNPFSAKQGTCVAQTTRSNKICCFGFQRNYLCCPSTNLRPSHLHTKLSSLKCQSLKPPHQSRLLSASSVTDYTTQKLYKLSKIAHLKIHWIIWKMHSQKVENRPVFLSSWKVDILEICGFHRDRDNVWFENPEDIFQWQSSLPQGPSLELGFWLQGKD